MLLLLLSALAALATAQQITIESPQPGTVLHRSRPTTMKVRTHNNETVQEISAVLSILACPDGACPNAGADLGTILYAGPFQPTGQPGGQNFNITIPESFPVGPAELLATHFVLVGDGHSPYIQIGGEYMFVV